MEASMLKDGLYEQVLNNKLDTELAECTDKLSITASIDKAEASKVLSKYLTEVVEKGLDNIIDNGGDISSQVELVNKIVSVIKDETRESDFSEMSVAERAEQLLSLFDKKNSLLALNENANIVRPETSIAQSSLFTGAIHEPQMYTELKKEIVAHKNVLANYDTDHLQEYGRSNGPYIACDLGHMISDLNGGTIPSAFSDQLAKTILYKGCLEKARPASYAVEAMNYSGLGIYIPVEARSNWNKYFKTLDWYTASGWNEVTFSWNF